VSPLALRREVETLTDIVKLSTLYWQVPSDWYGKISQ
jgi:hypothetical protein